MFTPERDDSWLEFLWARCCRLPFLQTLAERQRLAERFVGCNLVMPLADLLFNVLHARPVLVAQGIRAAQIHAWLAQPGTSQGDQLVSPAAQVEMDQGPDRNDPWRRIHLWLGREALLRYLNGNLASAAGRYAEETFLASFPRPGAGLPICQGRNQATLEAFQAWWEDSAQRLTQLLAQPLWPGRTGYTLRSLALLLSRELNARPHLLTELLRRKDEQLHACLSQFRRWTFLPGEVPRDWLQRWTSRLRSAVEAGDELDWSREDRAHLVRLLEWLRDNRLVNSPEEPSWDESLLWEYAARGQPLAAEELAAVESEWARVVNFVLRVEGAYPDAARRLAEDLFFAPSPSPFAPWVERTRFYWEGP